MNGVIAAGAVLCRFSIYPASIPMSNEMIYQNIEQTKANRHSMTMHMRKHIYTFCVHTIMEMDMFIMHVQKADVLFV